MTQTNEAKTEVAKDILGQTEGQETTSQSSEVKHESTLFAEPVFHFGQFAITNALLTSWLAVLIIIVLSVMVRKKIASVPRGIQNYAESVLEGAINLANSVTGSSEKSLKFLPIVFPLFIFILINNWLGLLPGVGSIGFIESHGGESIFVPLLRGGTADLNLTLALALMAVIATHIFGVITANAWGHLNRFINIKVLLEIPKKIFVEKEYTAILVNPIKFFVGLIEAVGELAKVASLSFRLFGNIFAGEVLLAAMSAIFAFILPLPFMFLEIIVGIIQALIFAILTLVFLTVMTSDHEHEEAH
ncbi:MAG: F0F1 ATP synthase subunit A [Candidatus Buchananbacteria bacterium]|nr:F0F1 ATP synthase subunit A [Candidatus Buchananbacteria bacterium]